MESFGYNENLSFFSLILILLIIVVFIRGGFQSIDLPTPLLLRFIFFFLIGFFAGLFSGLIMNIIF